MWYSPASIIVWHASKKSCRVLAVNLWSKSKHQYFCLSLFLSFSLCLSLCLSLSLSLSLSLFLSFSLSLSHTHTHSLFHSLYLWIRKKCRLLHHGNPYLALGPFRMEVASVVPFLVILHGLLTPEDTDHLVNISTPRVFIYLTFDPSIYLSILYRSHSFRAAHLIFFSSVVNP